MQMIKSSIWFWLCPMHVCMHTSHRHRQQSPRAINIIVIARFDHWTYKASKQLNEQAKHGLLYERGGNDRGTWQRQKKRESGKKRHSRSHTHIIRIHVDLRANIPYALYYFLFSFTCLPTQFKISSFTSFIYPLKHFVLPRSLVASFSLMPPLILFFSHICFLFSDSALWRSLPIIHFKSHDRMGKRI